MDHRIPFIVFGDGPRLPSGLARIARDLAARIYLSEEELGVRLIQVGVDPPGGWHWAGGWPFYGFQPSPYDQGGETLQQVCKDLAAEHTERPIVLAINDPARTYDLTRAHGSDEGVPADVWGYFPIDAENNLGAVGGPAQEAVQRVDRVLAYGKYGAGVLKRTLNAPRGTFEPDEVKGVQWLPHGLEPGVWLPGIPLDRADGFFQDWANQQSGTLRIGAVATNQPRKDLGLLVATVAELEHRGISTSLWLHTDLLTKVWDVGQLCKDFGLRKPAVCVTTGELADLHLAARYGWSDVTIAPGLGEGFGYPIVESLACGTPVVHGNYAGGVELIPDHRWVVEPSAWRIEGCYALQRPVLNPALMADAISKVVLQLTEQGHGAVGAFCAGSVAYLSWEHLWPRWKSWIKKGLDDRGRQQQPTA